jgi:uncharacterized protein (DUF58 family)
MVALWVAWRFVPRLAAAVEWRGLRFVTRFRLTREGWAAIGATVTVGLTAVNTSNNLLYMIFSALAATLLLSVLLAGLNFRSLVVEVSAPGECFAREPFPVAITVRNRKAVFPSFSIQLRPDMAGPMRFASSYLTMLGARGSETRRPDTACNRRGRHSIGGISLESRFPFGFFVRGGTFPAASEILAFPEIRQVDVNGHGAADTLGSRERFEPGHGMDLYSIRDYQSTDGARRVDWKASAKTSALKTREFAAEETRRIVILLDRFGSDTQALQFENLVSEAASLASHLVGQGLEVGLVTDEWTSNFASSDKTLRSILRYLALVEMSLTSRAPLSIHGGETLELSLR